MWKPLRLFALLPHLLVLHQCCTEYIRYNVKAGALILDQFGVVVLTRSWRRFILNFFKSVFLTLLYRCYNLTAGRGFTQYPPIRTFQGLQSGFTLSFTLRLSTNWAWTITTADATAPVWADFFFFKLKIDLTDVQQNFYRKYRTYSLSWSHFSGNRGRRSALIRAHARCSGFKYVVSRGLLR